MIVALANNVVLAAAEVSAVVMPTPPAGQLACKFGLHAKRRGNRARSH